MAPSVQVVANGQTFDVPESVHKRWAEDYPLATTKTGKPTAAARRAAQATPTTDAVPTAADTTKTASDLLAEAHAGDGDDTTKEAH